MLADVLLMPMMLVTMIHQTSCIPVTSDVDPRDLGTHIIPGPGVFSTLLAGSLHPTSWEHCDGDCSGGGRRGGMVGIIGGERVVHLLTPLLPFTSPHAGGGSQDIWRNFFCHHRQPRVEEDHLPN